MNPVLKQFGDLRPADFDASPVWASCHSFDYDEPWYDDTDEETFRPWTGAVPVDPSDGMFLVRATFRDPTGRQFVGFATPASPDAAVDLGLTQPYLAAGDRFIGFWGGMIGVPTELKATFYSALGVGPEIFPLSFSCEKALAADVCSGTVAGFYRYEGSDEVIIEL